MLNRTLSALLICIVLLTLKTASATIIPIGPENFSPNATIITYDAVPADTPIDGKIINGVLHNFTIGGISSSEATIRHGPDISNNISFPNIEGNAMGTLVLTFPELERRLGYGFAFPFGGTTSVELFDMSHSSIGGISKIGVNDPFFPGGFLGLESTDPFLFAQVSFVTDGPGHRFAFDNLTFEPVPAPAIGGGLPLLIIGGMLLLGANILERGEKGAVDAEEAG